MKIAAKQNVFTNAASGVQNLAKGLLAAALCLASGNIAQAHISYSGRDFGAFTGLSLSTVSITNQVVTGNFGWADAADGNLGDTHKGRAFRFHLDSAATIMLTVSANPSATGSSIGGLLPGFSIYSGLAAIAPLPPTQTSLPSSPDHDDSDASLAWRTDWAQSNLGPLLDADATDGSWNALGDWKVGGDGDLPGDISQLSSFIFKGFAMDGDLDGTAFGSFFLNAGDYTIFLGGNDINNKTEGTASASFGLSATLSVSPVPEPSTYALMALSAGFVIRAARRRKA